MRMHGILNAGTMSIILIFLAIPVVHAIDLQNVQSNLSIRRVVSTPGEITFSDSVRRFQRNFLLDVSGDLRIASSTIEASKVSNVVLTFTVLKGSQIIQSVQSHGNEYDFELSSYWSAEFWITVPLPDIYSELTLIAYFPGYGNASSSTVQYPLYLTSNSSLELKSNPAQIFKGVLPRSTSIVIHKPTIEQYGTMYYVSVSGTFTANYSMKCFPANSCGKQNGPIAPALPIGLTIHFIIADGKQIISTFDIVTDGLQAWTVQFWLLNPTTAYYLDTFFDGVPGEFSPTLAQTVLQV